MFAQHNYVISLTSAIQRRKHITQEFGKQNILFTFFDAITPDIIEKKVEELGINIEHSPLTKGEIACALSHITLWQYAKDENLDYICIFEDDIYLGENADKFFNLNYVDQNIHLVKFETHPIDKIDRFARLEKRYYGRKMIRLKSRHVGMAGYLITKKGIDFILSKIKEEPLNKPIDDLIFDDFLKIPNYVVWQIKPAICIQDFFIHTQTKFESSLKKERDVRCSLLSKKKVKKTFTQRIIRECKRPFIQMKKYILKATILFK